MNRPHEDPNCKCKACEEWAAELSPLVNAWMAEMEGWRQSYERSSFYYMALGKRVGRL